MKKKPVLLWLILLILLLLIPFIVPSALTYAGAEDTPLPVYSPVELGNPHPDPLALPDPVDRAPEHCPDNPDCYIYDEETGLPCGYQDDTIYIKIETAVLHTTKVYFTWIQIADPSQLLTYAPRYDYYPDVMAKGLDPIVCLSADWFKDREGGLVVRNGKKMRAEKGTNRLDVMIIDDQGDVHILRRPKVEDYKQYEGHVLHSFVFGPGLVSDGKILTDDTDTFVKNAYGTGGGMALTKRRQRQIFCQMGKLSYLIITTEGPQETPEGGFTAAEEAELAYAMGAINAYNFDGGNSACIVMKDAREGRYVKLNRYNITPRSITDLIYFVSAQPGPAADSE